MNIDGDFDIDKVRNHTHQLLLDAADYPNPVIIEAPPGSAKSTSVYELPERIDTPITYLSNRIDLYEQAIEWCEEEDVSFEYEVIPSPQRHCDTFRGNNSGDGNKVKELYSKGYSGRKIHYLDQATAYTPCMSGEEKCEYIQKMERIQDRIEEIDLLIGHYKHSYRHLYINDRIVVIDEFNPGTFLTKFPEEESGIADDPGEIIGYFLEQVGENHDSFPGESFEDITDIITKRSDPELRSDALRWFSEHGVSRSQTQDYDFWDVSTYRYDRTHMDAPLLTFSLFCMEKVGQGYELAPALDNNKLRRYWEASDIGPGTRCLRNRNTGEMFLLAPPDLEPAKQVIGLDAIPVIELWNLLFSSEKQFDHWKVIEREDFSEYLSESLNMDIVQVGDGMYPYAGGRVSSKDEERFAAIRGLEGEPFALISTKKALTHYRRQDLDKYVKKSPDCKKDENDFEMRCARNFGTILSSNAFEKESLGVVSGNPFPGDPVVHIWAGLCGKEVTSEGEGVNKSFGEFGDKIYEYLAHHQVVQAVLRFGRHEEVVESGGATVYVNTKALPEWFEVDRELDIISDDIRTEVIETLIRDKETESPGSPADHNVKSLQEAVGVESTHQIRELLSSLHEDGLLMVRKGVGKGGSDLFQWDGDNGLRHVEDASWLLEVGDGVFLLSLPDYRAS